MGLDKPGSAFEAFCNGVLRAGALSELDLGGCGLGPGALLSLAQALLAMQSAAAGSGRRPQCPPGRKLRALLLSGNELFGPHEAGSVEGGQATTLASAQLLKKVGVGFDGWQALCRALKQSKVRRLGVAAVGLGPWGAKELAGALPANLRSLARPEQNPRPALCGAHS